MDALSFILFIVMATAVRYVYGYLFTRTEYGIRRLFNIPYPQPKGTDHD